MPRLGTVKCFNCNKFFTPHPRSKGRQRFCSAGDCRTASKRHSQRRWHEKPQNRDYFKGPHHVRRVQQWRQQHPGYWRQRLSASDSAKPLQDSLSAQAVDLAIKKRSDTVLPLQDALFAQPYVFIGLIAQLTGCELQDSIVDTVQRLRDLGEDLWQTNIEGAINEQPKPPQSKAATPHSSEFQLGRSPPG